MEMLVIPEIGLVKVMNGFPLNWFVGVVDKTKFVSLNIETLVRFDQFSQLSRILPLVIIVDCNRGG